jgi:hypothetical protein
MLFVLLLAGVLGYFLDMGNRLYAVVHVSLQLIGKVLVFFGGFLSFQRLQGIKAQVAIREMLFYQMLFHVRKPAVDITGQLIPAEATDGREDL